LECLDCGWKYDVDPNGRLQRLQKEDLKLIDDLTCTERIIKDIIE
jgi:hypothetical protein